MRSRTTTTNSISAAVVRNPLIDDLLEDLSGTSGGGEDAAGDSLENLLQGQSISNNNSFNGFGNEDESRRRSEVPSLTTQGNFNPRSQMMLNQTMAVISKTSQHFVHTMRMNELDEFFCPSGGKEKPEDVLRRELTKKKPQELVTIVCSLVDLLEEVRLARSHVAPLTGSLSLLDGCGRNRAMSTSMFSTMSTASLMRPPVHETNQVATAYDQQGNKMINCYTVIANLGQGAWGKVKLGENVQDGRQVAIKIIDKKHLKKKIGGGAASDNQSEALKREIAIMKKVRHRNCVSLYEVIDDPDSQKLYLIMDYIPNGPVVRLKPQTIPPAMLESAESGVAINGSVYSKFLLRCGVRQRSNGGTTPLTAEEMQSHPTLYLCKPLSQHLCATYLRQLVSGLRYMHKRNLVHHDIKPDNILLGLEQNVYLSDFGVSEILVAPKPRESASSDEIGEDEAARKSKSGTASDGDDDDSPTSGVKSRPRLGGGTLLFSSPELFDEKVNQKTVDPYLTDVWALGVTLYCMLVGMAPYPGSSYREVRENVLTQSFPWNGKNLYNAALAPEWRVVLNGLLAKDPRKRWPLVRLKSFLDQQSFQDAMRKYAAAEALTRPRSSVVSNLSGVLVGGATTTSSSAARASRVLSLGKPPLSAAAPPASSSSSLLDPNPSPGLAGAGSSVTGAGFSLHTLGVSDQEVREATKTARIAVLDRHVVVSDAVKSVVNQYVDRVRTRLQQNNCFFSTSPTKGESGSSTSASVGKSSTASGSTRTPPVSVARVPSSAKDKNGDAALSPEEYPYRVTLFKPPRRESKNAGSSYGGRSSTSAPLEGAQLGLARQIQLCGSQSLDAMLSIVNLQSASHDVSTTFSFSSDSSSDYSGPATVAATPSPAEMLSKPRGRTGQAHLSKASVDDLSMSALDRPAGITETSSSAGKDGETSTQAPSTTTLVPSSTHLMVPCSTRAGKRERTVVATSPPAGHPTRAQSPSSPPSTLPATATIAAAVPVSPSTSSDGLEKLDGPSAAQDSERGGQKRLSRQAGVVSGTVSPSKNPLVNASVLKPSMKAPVLTSVECVESLGDGKKKGKR